MGEVPQADQIAAAFGAGALDPLDASPLGDPDEALARLREAVDGVVAEDGRADQARALMDLMADDALIDQAAVAWLGRRVETLIQVERLAALPGQGRRAKLLRQVIADAADAADATPREQKLDGVVYAIPAGWAVDDSGVLRVVLKGGEPTRTRVAHAPILLRRRLSDLDDHRELCEVAWLRGGRWLAAMLSRAEMADQRGLLALAGRGAPVHSGSVGEVVRFLADFEAANIERLPLGYASRTMGFVGRQRKYFLLGRELLHAEEAPEDIRLVDSDPGTAQLADALQPSGTWEGWCAAFAAVSEHPSATLAVYASACTPLLGIIPEAPNFGIDWSGSSGTGKTTSLQLAASVWGRPEEGRGAIRSWLGTLTNIERIAAAMDYLPLMLDESNKVPLHERERLGPLLYMIVNGSGKGRGNLTGTQAVTSWRTVLLSTGESQVAGYTQDEGTRNRIISVSGAPLGTGGAALAEATRLELLTHHGHLGPRWLRWLLGQRARWEEFSSSYRERVEVWRTRAEGRIEGRAAQYVALLDLAADLLMEAGLLHRPHRDPIAHAWRCAKDGAQQADRSVAALDLAFGWAASNAAAFYGRHRIDRSREPIVPADGWRGAWPEGDTWDRIGFVPDKLVQLLKARGFEADSILGAWKSRGWLKVHTSGGGKGRTYPMNLAGQRVGLVVVLRSALREAGLEGSGGEDE